MAIFWGDIPRERVSAVGHHHKMEDTPESDDEMSSFLRALGFTLALMGFIAVLIGIPAWLFGVFRTWQVIFLSVGYLFFFLGTVWRAVRFGKLASRSEDKQIKNISGKFAYVVLPIGLLGVHWLALYDFSQSGNSFDGMFFSVLAIALIAAAIVLSQIAIRTLGKFFDRLTIKTDHQLVKEGIYSVVRHPIYSSYLLLFIGFCTMLQSLLGLGLLAVVSIIWFGSRIQIEEAMLIDQFGDEYRTYQQQTKRLIPFVY
jgi:protein-S-isoprenylcysteine O-methyltransferase Ste14